MDLHPGEEIVFDGGPVWRSIMSFYVSGIFIALVVGLIVALVGSTAAGVVVWVAGIAIVVVAGLVQRIGTRYRITTQRLYIKRGILARRVQQTRIERVQNVNIEQTLVDRLLHVGAVDFDTAGTDDSDFTFRGVSRPDAVVAAVDRAQREASDAGRLRGAEPHPGGL